MERGACIIAASVVKKKTEAEKIEIDRNREECEIMMVAEKTKTWFTFRVKVGRRRVLHKLPTNEQ